NQSGPKEHDLVFVTGHPGTTNRLETYEKLRHRRDVTLPYTLARLRAFEAALTQFGERSPQSRQWAATDHHRVANSRKAFAGQYQGLLDPAVIDRKQREEAELLNWGGDANEPAELVAAREGVARIAAAQKAVVEFERSWALLERGDAFFAELFVIARDLIRLRAELPKPSAERLREYRDSNLESLKFQLFSPAPLHADLERAKLAAALTFLAENLGAEHS